MDAEPRKDILHVLQYGTLEIEGVLPWSSNYAFLVTACEDDVELRAVYKPRRGERPLWDFPRGTLSLRERAAFVVSEFLGWNLVPPTVLREGQHGPGSVQLFIAHDPSQHYFALEGDPLFRYALQKMALMDHVINNADRKGGHVIIEQPPEDDRAPLPTSDHLWGIDHGICFHSEYKLRTVIWEFAGEAIPKQLLAELGQFYRMLADENSELRLNLAPLLSDEEILAMQERTAALLSEQQFPLPGPGRHYPWPPI
ncbi:MAG: SCO1664 family protein [Candidatus Promineifilaceae bacterium]|jgi:Phosphatidylinositol 3- and 4-kinase